MGQLSLCLTMLLLAALIRQLDSFKILVAPFNVGFNSRLLNMQKMADMLAQDGHDVTVLMNTRVEENIVTKHAKVLIFKVPGNQYGIADFSLGALDVRGFKFYDFLESMFMMEMPFCEALYKDHDVMNHMREAEYDLIISDVVQYCNLVIDSHLNTTTMIYSNFGFFQHSDIFFPQFISFTCHTLGVLSCLTDEDLTFTGKIMNLYMISVWNYYLLPYYNRELEKLAVDAKIDLKFPLSESYKNRITLLNTDDVFDTPRPTMPHVFKISGMFHEKPSPLTPEFQAIVDKAGSDGLVLMTFGTLIPKFEPWRAEIFARVFGRLRQQVIWRFTGEPPKSLKENTHLTNWLPQADLLGSNVVKLFITHGGISSLYESAFNGVPVISLPLFADQFFNTGKLTRRVKMGLQVDYHDLQEEKFEKAVLEVLNNPFYKENAMKTSQILSDRIVSPQMEFLHLVNFTIKSGGAKHLFHPYAVDMNVIQFYGIDILAFLLAVILLVLVIVIYLLKFLYRLLFRRSVKQKTA